MSISNKFDSRMIVIVIVALIGGVIGGYLSNITMEDSRFESLSDFSAQLTTKDTEITTLSKTVSDLEEQISQLEVTIAEVENVPVIGFNTPDYDSGWIEREYPNHHDIHHNLGTTSLFVYLIGGLPELPHHFKYGGDRDLDSDSDGAYFSTVDENTIRVMTGFDSENWSHMRMLIWILPEPQINWQPVS